MSHRSARSPLRRRPASYAWRGPLASSAGAADLARNRVDRRPLRRMFSPCDRRPCGPRETALGVKTRSSLAYRSILSKTGASGIRCRARAVLTRQSAPSRSRDPRPKRHDDLVGRLDRDRLPVDRDRDGAALGARRQVGRHCGSRTIRVMSRSPADARNRRWCG